MTNQITATFFGLPARPKEGSQFVPQTNDRSTGGTLWCRVLARRWLGTSHKKSATDYLANFPVFIGAGEMNRTPDLLITNELLYRLSYTGTSLLL